MKTLIYIIFINITSFLLMFIDKRKAINHKWRISESTLLLSAILGGSIGAILGMNVFRHKTKHLKFKFGLPLILIIQLSLIIYIVTQY